jgi:hypothetical protein
MGAVQVYTTHEMNILRQEIAAQKAAGRKRIDFDVIAQKLPGRTTKGLYEKAMKDGLIFRISAVTVISASQKIKRAVEQEEPIPPEVATDALFQDILKRAILSGAERARIGTIKDAGTCRPRTICPEPIIAIRSNAGLAAELGDRPMG